MPKSSPSPPTLLFADSSGKVIDAPGIAAAERIGWQVRPVNASDLIPLPAGSELYLLPERNPLGYATRQRKPVVLEGQTAVAAFLPSGYVALSLAAYESLPQAPLLPLYAYAAVCLYRNQLHVPAIKIESDVKHDPDQFSERKLKNLVHRMRAKYPTNRLVRHLADNCALKYGCANAKNLFYARWECPIPVAPSCNAACIGCISAQPDAPISPPQDRLNFVPDVSEVLEIALPHLQSAPRAMLSFGQGCEGEPLLQGERIYEIVRAIRRETERGTIHLNTNGSRPEIVEKLCEAGLDSIRVSLNSAQSEVYARYYRPRLYAFEHVAATIRIAHERGLFTSINYLTFPGLTDSPREIESLRNLIESAGIDMIQWRNLNIDPDAYCEVIGLPKRDQPIGLRSLMLDLTQRYPTLRHGYVNPPRERWKLDRRRLTAAH